MKQHLYCTLFLAAVLSIPALQAAPMDTKSFQAAVQTIQQTAGKDRAKQADEFLKMLASNEDLTPDQRCNLCERAMGLAAARDASLDFRKRTSETVRAYLKTKNGQTLPAFGRARLLATLTEAEKNTRNEKDALAHFAELNAAAGKAVAAWKAESAKPKPDKALERAANDYTKLVWQTLVRCCTSVDFGKQMFAMAKPNLNESRIAVFEIGHIGQAARKSGDRKTFDALKAKALAMPFGPTRSEITYLLRFGAGEIISLELIEADLKNPQITPNEKIGLLHAKRQFAGDVRWFQRGLNNPEAYKRWRACTDELLKCGAGGWSFFAGNANTAFGYGDFAFAEGQIEQAVKLNRSGSMDTALMIGLWKKDHAKVAALVEEECASNKGLKDDQRIFLQATAFFDKHSFEDFLRDFCGDVEKKAGKRMSDKEKLLLVRRVSELFFRARRYEVCRDIYNGTFKHLYVKLEPKVYRVGFVDNPPRTADGFCRTKYFDDWKGMETRFWVYGDNLNMNNDKDVKRLLKESEQPKVPEEWRTGLYGLCDAEGLHLYLRCEDPAVEDIITKKRNGGQLECIFRPSAESAYHMWFFDSLPSATDSVNVDWSSPSPRYKTTDDSIFRDACMTKSGVAAHIFIPWAVFYRNLPFNGKVWYFGMQRYCKGGAQTISGQAHELARMLNLKFDFTPEQIRAIKRNICLTAFNTFKANRNLPVWSNDADLGDPKFYKQELDALVKELNEAGALLAKPDADFDTIFEKYVPIWMEFDYIVSEKRRNYLRKSFFE